VVHSSSMPSSSFRLPAVIWERPLLSIEQDSDPAAIQVKAPDDPRQPIRDRSIVALENQDLLSVSDRSSRLRALLYYS
jgi:hypothetical protein